MISYKQNYIENFILIYTSFNIEIHMIFPGKGKTIHGNKEI